MSEVIRVESLVKYYGKNRALDGLNLKVHRGSLHGFLGPNGAGKTTTIKILLGLLKPNEGSISLFGEKVTNYRPELRRNIGYMPELPRFPKHLTAFELMDIYGEMYGMNQQARKEQIPQLLELVGLRERARDRIGSYSKGMQQRLGLAQALLSDPQLLIMDEPTLGLDPVGMVEVREILKKIKREGRTIFLSSHLLYEVEQVCTDVTIIHRGKALMSGSLGEVSSMGKNLEDVFIKLVGPEVLVEK